MPGAAVCLLPARLGKLSACRIETTFFTQIGIKVDRENLYESIPV